MVLGLSSVQSGTLLIALATLFGAAFGSFAQYILKLVQRRRERDNLRNALIAEMKLNDNIHSISEISDDDEAYIRGLLLAFDSAPTHVYDSNVGNLGMLSREEVEQVTYFYTAVNEYSTLTQMYKDEIGSGGDEVVDFKSGIKSLENDRERAITELENNLSGWNF